MYIYIYIYSVPFNSTSLLQTTTIDRIERLHLPPPMVCCRALAGCVLTGRRNVPIKSEEIPSFFFTFLLAFHSIIFTCFFYVNFVVFPKTEII